jgi:energy-converting hydrogenase A subunit M
MTIEKNNKFQWNLDKKKLLDKLANDIAHEFWIDKEKTEKLIKSETLVSLDSLKNELKQEKNNKDNLNNKELEKLFFTLRWALDVIEKSSKIEIKILKEDVEKSINIEEFKNHIEYYLPAKLIDKAKNPNNPHEHILWLALGTTNSIIATIDILYKIWKWIIQTPYHIYIIIIWKAKTNSFKNI